MNQKKRLRKADNENARQRKTRLMEKHKILNEPNPPNHLIMSIMIFHASIRIFQISCSQISLSSKFLIRVFNKKR
jgi:hypothetical protein